MTKKDTHLRSTHTIRFDPDTLTALRAAADERTVSVSWLVNRLCADGLRRLIPPADITVTKDDPPT